MMEILTLITQRIMVAPVKAMTRNSGLTLIETLAVVAISTLLLIALVSLVGRSFQISREQFEQVRTTEDARLNINRISETIRNARPRSGLAGEECDWLVKRTADGNRLTMITNGDSDDEPEQVDYSLGPDIVPGRLALKRTVFELHEDFNCTATDTKETQVLVRGVINDATRPLFRYYARGGSAAEVPVSPEQGFPDTGSNGIGRIGISLWIDVEPRTAVPGATEVATQVTVRNALCTEKTVPGGTVVVGDQAYTDYQATCTLDRTCPGNTAHIPNCEFNCLGTEQMCTCACPSP
jgi:type II secretory pathway pseudopilin PulG